MTNLIVSGPTMIVNVAGLRFVEKIDRAAWCSEPPSFSIHLLWKGQEQHHKFTSRVERDAFYDEIVKRLSPAPTVPK